MECVTCKSARISRFIDGFGSERIFCRNCWVSFPADSAPNARRDIHANFSAVRRTDSY